MWLHKCGSIVLECGLIDGSLNLYKPAHIDNINVFFIFYSFFIPAVSLLFGILKCGSINKNHNN